MPLCVVHVSMSPCLPVCAHVAILLVSVHVGILSWRSNNPDPPSHDVVFFSQFADAGICASLVVPVRPPADATPAAVCGTMALSAVPRIPCLQVPMSMSWAFFLSASVILPLSTEAGGDSHTELQPKKGPHAPHSPNPSRVRVLITVLGNAMHAVRTQCEVLDVGKYSNPSFGPLSQVFGSVPGFFWLPKHLGCGIFELSTISP